MESEILNRCLDAAAHLNGLCGVDVFVLDCGKRDFCGNGPQFCGGCECKRCDAVFTHMYGGNEASRWGGKYVYFCPLGLVFASSPVFDGSKKKFGYLVAGPVVMGETPDTLTGTSDETLTRAVHTLPGLSASSVTHLSEVLRNCAAGLSEISGDGTPYSYDYDKAMSAVYDVRDSAGERFFYPIEYEKQLHELIVAHDKSGVQALLNELLGHIYFASNYDLPTVKARVTELLVLLSRAIIDAGADVSQIFSENSNHFHELEQLDSLEELNVWLSAAIHRFVNYTFDFSGARHSDAVYKAMDYIRNHYSEKITLEDVANCVFLSRSYLSKVFKEETGIGVVDYIKKVRIEKSKLFLLDKRIKVADVAEICGFEDQSYFTKVFGAETGVSPKKYRDNRGRAEQ